MPEETSRSSSRSVPARDMAAVATMVAAALVALSLLWIAAATHAKGGQLVDYLKVKSCIDAAQAKYPAVPVSAFIRKDTGPLKVSYVNERTRAVTACGRF